MCIRYSGDNASTVRRDAARGGEPAVSGSETIYILWDARVLGEPLRAHPSEVGGVHAARYAQSGAGDERGQRDEENDDRPHKCWQEADAFKLSIIVPVLRVSVCTVVDIVTDVPTSAAMSTA